MKLYSVLMFLLVGTVLCERRRYDGYQMLEVEPINEAHIKLLADLESDGQIEVVSHPHVGGTGLIIVPSWQAQNVPIQLAIHNLAARVIDKNIQRDIDAEFERLDARYAANSASFDLEDFNRLETIYQQYDRWIAACPAGLTCELIKIGKTYEQRDHIVLKVGKTGSTNKALFLESILHSREWLAAATELKIINRIFTRYGSDPEVTRLVDKYDWYFLPVGNPDGYVYSWDADRYWRKNRRRPFAGAPCVGTDLNRNFEAYFGKEGASPNVCAMTYPGPGPNSEPETQNIVRFTKSIVKTQQLISHLCIHTSGKMWMFPYGHTINHAGRVCVRTTDHRSLTMVTNAAVDALEQTWGEVNTWRKGTICEVIYPATGDEISFAYDILKVKYPFALELRGRGFVVPKSEIPKSFAEIWNALAAMIAKIEEIEGA